MKSLKYLALVLSISLSCISHSLSQTKLNVDANLKEYLNAQRDRMGFSGVVLVTKKNGERIKVLTGLAERSHLAPITGDSKYKIASMTKSFTALLLTMAEQEGRLCLEDHLEDYFPELEDKNWKEITLSQLMSHTAGVPHWSGFENYWSVNSRIDMADARIIEHIFNMNLLFQAGSKASYSSPGYFLLAIVLERVYGRPYSSILDQYILSPLSMKASNVYDDLTIIPIIAAGYHMTADERLVRAPYRNPKAMKGGGDMYSTAADITKWCRSFLSNEVWGDSILQKVFTPSSSHLLVHKKGQRYGRGWYLEKDGILNEEAFLISGGTFGFSSKAAIYPSSGTSIVLLANTSFLPVDGSLWEDIEKIVFELPFEMPRELELSNENSVQELEVFVGSYKAAENMPLLEIILENGNLFGKLGRKPAFLLTLTAEETFLAKKIEGRRKGT